MGQNYNSSLKNSVTACLSLNLTGIKFRGNFGLYWREGRRGLRKYPGETSQSKEKIEATTIQTTV